MNTISKNILLRLTAQANEADLYGDIKTADSLTKQIEKYAAGKTRDDEEPYEYDKEQLVSDVHDLLWDAVVRIFDYYEATPDAKEIQDVVDDKVAEFIEAIETFIPKDIGAHEPEVVGEEHTVPEHEEVEESVFTIPEDDDDDSVEEDDDLDDDEDDDDE